MKKILLLSVLFTASIICLSQTKFRSGIFLHHSTGGCIWGPNGSSTSIPQEMTAYNIVHSYTGGNAVSMTEEWWSPSDNEWSTQHNFFEDPSPVTGIGYYTPNNKIVVIKSCFPSSDMSGMGNASDTNSPTTKSMYNYKWHWRHIVEAMSKHPDNFFVIWTNAPLVAGATNSSAASLSKNFCKWAKDTLANGLDPVVGAFPSNIYVFDFFSKLTDANGYLQSQYAASSSDSHPNSAATALVAPQFVNEIFDAAIAYELLSDVNNNNIDAVSIYPNPNNGTFYINGNIENTYLKIFNLTGNLIYEKNNFNFSNPVKLDCIINGVYFIAIETPNKAYHSSVIIQK
ncbi:MAG: T9SS type A sorting domain-containing protein [Bacteroidales bacterium]|jgi:hypothetical protein